MLDLLADLAFLVIDYPEISVTLILGVFAFFWFSKVAKIRASPEFQEKLKRLREKASVQHTRITTYSTRNGPAIVTWRPNFTGYSDFSLDHLLFPKDNRDDNGKIISTSPPPIDKALDELQEKLGEILQANPDADLIGKYAEKLGIIVDDFERSWVRSVSGSSIDDVFSDISSISEASEAFESFIRDNPGIKNNPKLYAMAKNKFSKKLEQLMDA